MSCPRDCGPGGQKLGFIFIPWGVVLERITITNRNSFASLAWQGASPCPVLHQTLMRGPCGSTSCGTLGGWPCGTPWCSRERRTWTCCDPGLRSALWVLWLFEDSYKISNHIKQCLLNQKAVQCTDIWPAEVNCERYLYTWTFNILSARNVTLLVIQSTSSFLGAMTVWGQLKDIKPYQTMLIKITKQCKVLIFGLKTLIVNAYEIRKQCNVLMFCLRKLMWTVYQVSNILF